MELESNIILFDGECNLCNHTVQFIIKRDPKKIFKFTSLQSAIGKQLIQKHQIDSKNIDSVILLENKKVYLKSKAAMRMAKSLKGIYPIFYYGSLLLPLFVKDGIYDFIARNRYKWFGTRQSCWPMTPELKDRFL